MTLLVREIWHLAHRFVPKAAADRRLYDCGARSWWPAHEIGHFLVATPAECSEQLFGLDLCPIGFHRREKDPTYRYVISREIAATSISQRMLRRSGHAILADEEIQYTDEDTLECSFESWCRRSVERLLRANKVLRLPTTRSGLEALLARKTQSIAASCGAACEVHA